MSETTVIGSVGETLIQLLRDNLPDVSQPSDNIILYSPGELGAGERPRLMLFLYNIRENEYMKNQEVQSFDQTLSRQAPLTIDLFYMLTPYPSDESDKTERTKSVHAILGRAMQIFHDNRVLRGSVLKGCLKDTDTELHLLLSYLPLEEQSQIWSSMGDSALFRFSVFYMVTPVEIDSSREIEVHRVIEKTDKSYQSSEKKNEKNVI